MGQLRQGNAVPGLAGAPTCCRPCRTAALPSNQPWAAVTSVPCQCPHSDNIATDRRAGGWWGRLCKAPSTLTPAGNQSIGHCGGAALSSQVREGFLASDQGKLRRKSLTSSMKEGAPCEHCLEARERRPCFAGLGAGRWRRLERGFRELPQDLRSADGAHHVLQGYLLGAVCCSWG